MHTPGFTTKTAVPGAPLTTVRHPGAFSVMDVLVVEDDGSVRGACAGIAENFGCRVRLAASVPEAQAALAERAFDVVLLDLRLPGGSGAALFDEIRQGSPPTSVIVMTDHASVNSAVELMRKGAADFLAKPFSLTQVTAVLERAAEQRQWTDPSRLLEDRLEAGIASGALLGRSPGMRRLFRIVSKVAFTRHPVLLTGERGTGKETVARAIHANGPTPLSPFLPVDCDSLDPHRLESELFGSASAVDGFPGLLAAAGDGTVFLEEIGALDPACQSRLLRALESRQIHSTAGQPGPPLQARVLAASSIQLETLVDNGRFRKDLFYKLSIVHLRVPPLRERAEDVALLTEYFLEEQRRDRGIPFRLSAEVVQSMAAHMWPGNVGELRTFVEHACSMASDSVLHFDDLPTQVRNSALAAEEAPHDEALDTPSAGTPQTLQEMERQAVLGCLRQLKGDKAQAARMLGIGKTTLYRKLKEYGIADDVL